MLPGKILSFTNSHLQVFLRVTDHHPVLSSFQLQEPPWAPKTPERQTGLQTCCAPAILKLPTTSIP